ncbi:MAG: hypothetical protein ACOCVY_03310 [Patescibacteria group bacterium]
MKSRILLFLLLGVACFVSIWKISASASAFAYKNDLAGKILLQTQGSGEAWYIRPEDNKKYYLGSPENAFEMMTRFGTGISDKDLLRLPIGVADYDKTDSDGDGLSDSLEKNLGTDPEKADTDGDGYDDKTEILHNYNPAGKGKPDIDKDFAEKHSGKIFLQVEADGEAWYINPGDGRRYFLNRPSHAFAIMKKLSLGATDQIIENIPAGELDQPTKKGKEEKESGETEEETEYPEESCSKCSDTESNKGTATAKEAITKAEGAIRRGDKDQAVDYFIEDMHQAVTYTVDFLDEEGRYTLANTLSGSEVSSSGEDEVIYSNSIDFSGEEVKINFRVEKRDGRWFMASL